MQTNPIFKIISLLVQIKCNILNVSFISIILIGVKLDSYQNIVRTADHDTEVISDQVLFEGEDLLIDVLTTVIM